MHDDDDEALLYLYMVAHSAMWPVSRAALYMPLLLTNSASKFFRMATAYCSSSDESCLFGAEYQKSDDSNCTHPLRYLHVYISVNKRMPHGVMQVHNFAYIHVL